MNRRVATRLATRIRKDAPTVEVTGLRVYRFATGSVMGYALDCCDTVSGFPFVVTSPEAWADRMAAAQIPFHELT